MAKGILIVVSGPSGTGKGTICSELLRDSEIKYSTSMTTRKPRPGEIDGEDYFFVSREEFLQIKADDGFLETAETYGNFYGTPRAEVLDMIDEGRDVLLEIDPKGALQVRDAYPETVMVFILPPSMAELRRRIESRASDSQEVIERRLSEAYAELEYMSEYNYSVVNDDLYEAVAAIEAIVKAEHCKVTPEEVDEQLEQYKEER